MPRCPPENDLRAYAAGRIARPDADRIQRHLAACDRCRAVEASLRADEELAGKLRVAVRSRAGPEGPEHRDATETELPPPHAIEGYDIQAEIGRGGMGVVYRAIQESTKRTVALKVMLQGPFGGSAGRRRFQREIELAAELVHPNIVPVFDSGTHEGYPYFAMQYVNGVSLSEHLAGESYSTREKLELFLNICSAVSYAHQRGIIHRDLKPSNIMVDPERRVYVLDFGLAKVTTAASAVGDSRTLVSIPGQILGTLPYMAPEQVLGTPADLDVRTDVYALGVILFELLTGEYPYEIGDSVPQALRTIAETEPRSPRKVAEARRSAGRVDRELEAIVLRALAKPKEHRYQSVAELARDLERYLRGEPIEARRDSGFYMLRKTLARYRGYVMAAALAFAVVTTASIVVGRMYWKIRALTLETARTAFLEANQAYAQGRFGEALERLDQALEQNPNLSEAQLLRAQTLLMMDRRDEAVAYLENLLRLDPNAWVAHYALAQAYGADPDRSRYHRDQVLRLRPDTAEAYFATSLGVPDDEAVAWLARALERNPDHYESRIRRATLLVRAGRLDEAERDADIAIRLRPGGEQGWWWRAEALLRQRRYAAALPLFREAATIKPSYRTYYGLATAHRRLREYRRAIEAYSKILKLSPMSWELRWILYHRATLYWIVGEPAAALADYDRFAEYHRAPFWSDARRFLILREVGRGPEAVQHLEQAASSLTGDSWLKAVFEYLLGLRTADSLVALASTTGQRCEANYYVAENCFQDGDIETARRFYEACLATGLDCYITPLEVTPSNEYQLAEWRLRSLRRP